MANGDVAAKPEKMSNNFNYKVVAINVSPAHEKNKDANYHMSKFKKTLFLYFMIFIYFVCAWMIGKYFEGVALEFLLSAIILAVLLWVYAIVMGRLR